MSMCFFFLQESATSVQQLNQSSASERLGSSVPESLLTTGEALDTYQIVAEKVHINLSYVFLFFIFYLIIFTSSEDFWDGN